jgi:putative oxidoreductase
MDVVFLIGRILFVVIFVFSGVTVHIIGREQGIQYARAYGTPLPEIGVPLTGMVAIVGGVSVLLGVWADLGALLIAGFLVLITPFMHAFWKEQDPAQKQAQTFNFLKNTALLGAALVIFYAYNQLQGDAGLSITDPLFGRG